MELISIITPMYNAKSFISSTIESVCGQTYQNWEYILVDDHSIDGTLEFVRSNYGSDSRIKILSTPKNGGAGVARNVGLEHANGDLIAFLDADDIWHKEKLGKQLEFMRFNKSPIVHTSYTFVNEDNEPISGAVRVSSLVTLSSYMKNTEIGMSTSLINKKLVGEFSFNTMRTRQDTRLWLDLLGAGFVSSGLDENLVKYRIRKGQISGNKFVIAWRTFKLYMSFDSIPLTSRIVNFFFYASNAVIKRFK
jgi:teichuronic acid biosynthesis glycosyltransferase TuaG